MIEKVNKLIDNYYKPTPKKLRKIGDAIVAATTFAATFAIVSNVTWLSITIVILGTVGKYVTNFWAEDPDNSQSQN